MGEEFFPNFEPIVQRRPLAPDRWLKVIGIAISIAVGLFVIGWGVSDWWLGHIPFERLVSKLYARIYRYGRWIGIPTRPGETPYEFSATLILMIQSLAEHSFWADWLLKGESEVEKLTEALVIQMFNPSRISLLNRREIIQAYKRLRPRLWLLWLLRRAYNHRITWPLFWRLPPVYNISMNRVEP